VRAVGSALRPPSTGQVVTVDNTRSPAALYTIVDNDQSLLDASDLIFVDSPGTGFSRGSGKDNKNAFYGSMPMPTPSRSSSPDSYPNTRLMRGSGLVAAP
jgi:hypothetical protein